MSRRKAKVDGNGPTIDLTKGCQRLTKDSRDRVDDLRRI